MGLGDDTPYKHIFRCSASERPDVTELCDVCRVLLGERRYDWVGVVESPLGSFGAFAKGDSLSAFHTPTSAVYMSFMCPAKCSATASMSESETFFFPGVTTVTFLNVVSTSHL